MRVVVGASSCSSVNAKKLLSDAGIELVENPFGRRLREDEIIEHLKGADGLLAGLEPLNRHVLESADRLKAISRIGIGVENIDFEAAKNLGIKVSSTPDGPTKAVAEMTLAALLTIAHRIIPSNADVHNRIWKKRMGFSLDGTNVLIVGYGRIGRLVASKLELFGCHITVYDPFLPDISAPNLADAVQTADVISLHAAGNVEILSSVIFVHIKKGAVILNSARGGLVNEHALYNALNTGAVSWFWGDALWQEPYTGIITECENAILTPHICTYTTQCRESIEMQAVQNLLRDLDIV